MTWQRPPFDPRRAKIWSGGFSRVFGVVSDGVTKTYGLRATAAAYLVLFDGVFVDPENYCINPNDLSFHLDYVPYPGGWIEVLGFGVQDEHYINPSKWLTHDIDLLQNKLPYLTPAINPHYAVEQLNRETVHSVNGMVIGKDGWLYAIPQDEYDIIRVDAATQTTERIRVPELDLYDYGKFAGGFSAPNGKIYGIPDKAAAVMEYDPATRKGRMLHIEPALGDHVWTNDMINTGAAVGDRVYGIPFDADFFMVIDGFGDRIFYDTFGLDLSAPGKWYGGVEYNGEFFAVPYNHTDILRVKSDGTLQLIPLTTQHPEYAGKYRGGCVVGNEAYFAPFEADHVLVFNLDTFAMREERYGLDARLKDRFKFWGCAAAFGRVVFVPFEFREILEVDTRDGTAKFTTYNLYEDILDVFRAYAGAYTDSNSNIHFLSYNNSFGLTVDVERQQAYVRKTTARSGMYTSGEVRYQDGCQDGEGRIFINPYNTDGVHWTVDTRKPAVDYSTADWVWTTKTGNPYLRPAFGDRAIVGARDYGDHYWLLRDDGDINQLRLSGLEWGFWTGLDTEDPTFTAYVPTDVGDPAHFPTWQWKRRKAFFNNISADNGRLYALPSSQPFYVDRKDMPEKIYGQTTPRVGLSRDQWYNGTVRASDGKIYAIPYNGTHVMIFDPTTELIEYKDYGLDMMGRRKWYGGVRYNNLIIGIPFDHPGFLFIDTVAGTARIETFGYDLSGKRKFMSAARRGDEIIFVPCDHNRFFFYNPGLGDRDMVDLGLPSAMMNEKLKWGCCGLDKNNYLVCGPLGIPRGLNIYPTDTANMRYATWISPTGAAGYSTQKFAGASGILYMTDGTMLFRTKETFAPQDSVNAGPRVVPPVTGLTGANSLLFRQFRNIHAFGFSTDCAYTIDHWIYTMTEGRDMVASVNLEDWSVYNERYDDVPGFRPWLGTPPAAWTQFDPDEAAAYPTNELYAYRKTCLWNDPIFVGNNTAYGIHCSAGVVTRNTVTQYNHFREYIWDTNNYIRCWYGAVDTPDAVYAVPHSLPLHNILDKATGKSAFKRFVPPTGWDHTVLFKDGTWFDGNVVFFPYKQKWFGYHNVATNTTTYYEIPAALMVVDGWRAWVRRGDKVWGIPYNASYFLCWDLATKTCIKVADQPESENWRGKLWSEGMTFYKSESSADRDTVFLLPYNDDRLGVMYPWEKTNGPLLELEHFNTRFAGAKKWVSWAVPPSATPMPLMYGVPEDAEGVLVCDVRGDEPYVTDFDMTDLNWSQTGKWSASVDFMAGGTVDQASSDAYKRPLSLFVPYNSEELLIIDHYTGKAHRPVYNGPSLAGGQKWWGGLAVERYFDDWPQRADSHHYALIYLIPFDAPGVLAMRVRDKVINNEVVFYIDAQLMDFGMDMSGVGKWRGGVVLGPKLLMIPYNANRFLVIDPPVVDKDHPNPPISDTTAYQHIIGIPVEYLDPLGKWAPTHTTTRNDDDLYETNLEFEFPAENHPYTLRVSYNTQALQGYMVPHEKYVQAERNWRAVRHSQPWNPKYRYSFGIPWETDTFIAMQGSKCDFYCAGLCMTRPAKFAAATLDRDDNIICVPAGGFQALKFLPDENRAEWVRQSNSANLAMGDCEEFAYKAPGGKIYCAVKAEHRNNRLENGAVGTFQPLRYIHKLGDIFTIDDVMEYQDTHSYWPRWFSFADKNTAQRYRDAGCNDPSTPVHTYSEHRMHGCTFASPTGFGMFPGNTGNMLLYKRAAGRDGFSRRQLSLVHSCGTSDVQRVRSPNTYFPVSAEPGIIWLMPTSICSDMEITYGSSDPMFVHRVDTATGNIEHLRMPIPWRGRTETFDLVYWTVGSKAYMMPRKFVKRVDGTDEVNPLLCFDAATATFSVHPVPAEAREEWDSETLDCGDGTYTLVSRDLRHLLHLNADGTIDKPMINALFGGTFGAYWSYTGRYEECVSAGATRDGKQYYPILTFLSSMTPYYAKVSCKLRITDLITGTSIAETYTLDMSDDPRLFRADITSGASFFRGNKLYITLSTVPGKSSTSTDVLNNLYFLVLDLDTGTLTMGRVPGAPTWKYIRAFDAPDGTVWLEAPHNARLFRFMRMHPEDGWADEPTRTQKHVGCSFMATRLFQATRVVEGNLVYLVTANILSRNSVLYILNLDTGEMRSYGYMLGVKDTHKWNGCAYDDRRYLYGMPYNTDVLLRLDFDDPDNVKIEQRQVDDFSYVDSYNCSHEGRLTIRGLEYGNDLTQILHASGPAENFSRGGTVDKYGNIFANSYAPLSGQTLYIRSDGKTRVRPYGPDYTYPRKWADAAMADDGKIYAAPFDAVEVMTIDPNSDGAGSSCANMREGLEGDGKYSIAQAGAGFVAMLPFNAENILIVDHVNERFYTIDVPGIDLTGERKWWGSARIGNWVYCAPYDSKYVLKFNMVTRTGALLAVPDGATPADHPAKWRCLVAGGDGCGYAAPFDAGDILRVNFANDEVTRFSPSLSLSDPKLWSVGALSRDGSYMLAGGGNGIDYFYLRFVEEANPETGEMELRLRGDRIEPNFTLTQNANRHSFAWNRTASVEDAEGVTRDVDQWFFAPSDMKEPLTAINTTFALGEVPKVYTLPTQQDKWRGGYMVRENGADKEIILLPHNYDRVAKIDLDGKLDFQDMGLLLEGSSKWGCVFAHNGVVYHPPYNSPDWMVYDSEHFRVTMGKLGKPVVPAGTERWASVVQFDNKVFGIPFSSRLAFYIDTKIPESSLSYGSLYLSGSALAGEKKWKNSCMYEGLGYCAPYNAENILTISAAGEGALRIPNLQFDSTATFCGAAKLGQHVVLANDAYEFAMHGTPTKLLPRFNITGTSSTEGRTGGAVALSDGSVMILPGVDRRYTVVTEDSAGRPVYVDRDVPVDAATGVRSVSAVERSGTLYLIPFSSNMLFKYDIASKSMLSSGAPSPVAGSWAGGTLLSNGNILGVPYNHNSILQIVPAGAASNVTMGIAAGDLAGNGKWWGAASANNKHYFIPYNSNKVLVVDDSGGSPAASVTDFGLNLSGTAKWRGAVVRGPLIICIPYMRGDFLVIDSSADTAELVDDIGGMAGFGKNGAFVDDGVTVWLAPRSGAQLVKLSLPTTTEDLPDGQGGTFTRWTVRAITVSVTTQLDLFGAAKYAGCFPVEEQGKVVFVPRGATNFLEYYPIDNHAVLKSYGLNLAPGEKYSGVAKNPDGKVYFSGWESTRAVLDLGTWKVTNLNPTGQYDTGIVTSGALTYIKSETNTVYVFQGGTRQKTVTLTGVDGFAANRNSFVGMAADNRFVYMAPFDAKYLFALPLDETGAYRQVFAALSAEAKWAEMIPNEAHTEAYALPFSDSRIFHHNGKNSAVLEVPGVPDGQRRWMGGVWHNGKIYGAPFDAKGVAVYDPASGVFTVELFGLNPLEFAAESKWKNGFVHGDEIFFFPYTHSRFLVINPTTGTARTIDPLMATSRANEPMWRAWVEREGKWYGIPYQAEDVSVFDPSSGTLQLVHLELELEYSDQMWACGRAASNGDVIFLPYHADRAMYLAISSRKAKLTTGGSKDWMDLLRPFIGTGQWRANAELEPDVIPDEDPEKPYDPEAPVEPDPPLDTSWKFFAVSASEGVAQYDRDTGAVSKNVSRFTITGSWDSDQFSSFVYSDDSGLTYGIPFNAQVVLQVHSVSDAGTGSTSIGTSRMSPDLEAPKVKYEHRAKDHSCCWWIYGDNFTGSARNTQLHPVLCGGSSRMMLRIDPFTGVLYKTDLNGFLEWERPKEVIPVEGGEAIEVDHNLYDNKGSAYSGVVMAPDGLLYTIPNGSHWALAWHFDDWRDRVYAPYGKLENADDSADATGMLKVGAQFEKYSCGAVAANGDVIMAAGWPVTGSMTNKQISGWVTKTWFDRGERHQDSLGHFTDRMSLAMIRIDTGVKVDSDHMFVISPLLNGG